MRKSSRLFSGFVRAKLLLGVTLLPALQLYAQGEGSVLLRSDTRLVQVDVTVRDSSSKPVEGLQKSDFTILDNGKQRPFTIFSSNSTSDAAVSQTEPEALPVREQKPDGIFTNADQNRPAASDQHSTIILLDGVNGWFESFARGSKGVQGLMARLPAGERIAVYVITKFNGLLQLVDYTADRERVRKAIGAYIPPHMDPAPPDPPIVTPDGHGMDEMVGPAAKGPPTETAYLIQRASEDVRESFNALSEKLRTVPGRKSIFWVTEGFPARLIRSDPWEKTFAALNDANIAVNTVDDDGLGGPMRLWGGGGIVAMQLVAKSTGGQAFFHRNDIDDALAEGVANSRTDYTLGFYLGDLDGDYHELKVRVDRPGVQLSHRLGYIAETDAMHDLKDRKSDIESALLSPLDLTGVGIKAKIDHDGGNLIIHLQLSPESLTMVPARGASNGKVEELFIEKNDAGGELARVRQTDRFHIGAAGKADFHNRGAILTQEMRLAASATKLIVVVRDSASGRTGSLTVPLI